MVSVGDCLNLLPRDQSIDLIFADPPYNIGVKYRGYDDRNPNFVEFIDRFAVAATQSLKPNGQILFLMSDEYAAECCVEIKKHLRLRQWLIWYEAFGVNCKNKFTRSKRHLFHFIKGDRYTFNREAFTRPSARQTKYHDKRANPAGRLWDDVIGIEPPIPRVCGTHKERLPGFPTQLPLALLAPLVLGFSNPGDLVCDPFAGSGTTGVAARQTGRRFIGFELNAEYAAAANKRIEDASS